MTDAKYLVIGHESVPSECTIVERKRNRLQVDIDSDVIPEIFFERLEKLHIDYPVERVLEWSSKSGNKHVEIELKSEAEVPDHEAIILQLFLGSDPVREYLSCRRIRAGIHPATCLFKPVDSMASEVAFG